MISFKTETSERRCMVECVGITHNMLLVDPHFMDKIKAGDRVTMVKDRDCIVDGNYSISVFYKNDFTNMMGHVRRIHREEMMRLVERYGKVRGRVAMVGATTCMLDIENCYSDSASSSSDWHTKSALPKEIIDESLVIKSNKEDTSLEMITDILLDSIDRFEIIDYSRQYLKAYGHSISGDHERDYKRVVAKLRASLLGASGLEALQINDILEALDTKNRRMTSGDNVVTIFYEQLSRLRKSAERRGGMFDRLLSRYLHKEQNIPMEWAISLKDKVDDWLNDAFDNLYNADMKTYIKRIAYEALGTQELYTIMTYILISQFLDEKISQMKREEPHIDEEYRDETVRNCILTVINLKQDGRYLMTRNRQWLGIFRILVDEGIVRDKAFGMFGEYIRRLFPDEESLRLKLDANDISRIYYGVFAKPFAEWDFMKYDGQKAVFDRYYIVARTFLDEIDKFKC